MSIDAYPNDLVYSLCYRHEIIVSNGMINAAHVGRDSGLGQALRALGHLFADGRRRCAPAGALPARQALRHARQAACGKQDQGKTKLTRALLSRVQSNAIDK
jgi:hypothetical protein